MMPPQSAGVETFKPSSVEGQQNQANAAAKLAEVLYKKIFRH